MAFVTYPLNNIEYQAEDAELFHCTRTSGIWAEDSFPITVTGDDNNVTIGTGIAWINNEAFSGKVAAMKAAETLDLGIADSVYPRIDVIAIQFSVNANATSIVVKKGSPASSPVRPAIARTGSIYELYLCEILRTAGATTITSANVTDLRLDPTVCGLMADSVTEIDTAAINSQVVQLITSLKTKIEEVESGSDVMRKSTYDDDGNGIISTANGGTGKTTHTANSVLTGNGADAINNVATASGALFATEENGEAQFDTLPVAQGGTGSETAEEALENLGAMGKWELLWENASPSSAFGEQTIPLDLSEYDFVVIRAMNKTDDTNKTYEYFLVGVNDRSQLGSLFLRSDTTAQAYTRIVIVTESNIQFNTGWYQQIGHSARTESTSVIVPNKIYGIKN